MKTGHPGSLLVIRELAFDISTSPMHIDYTTQHESTEYSVQIQH